MGYFSNATEGEMYQAKYCRRCVHWVSDAVGCPCWIAHEVWNYHECNKPDSVLHKMIPREGVFNGQCAFFREAMLPVEEGK